MSAFISLSGPHEFSAELIAPHATVWDRSDGVTAAINLITPADCDDLTSAAGAAKDLLLAAQATAALEAEADARAAREHAPEADPCGCCLCVCPDFADGPDGVCSRCRAIRAEVATEATP